MTARRWFAIGDPQTTFDTFLDVLRGHGLLHDGKLRDDVGLVSIGDHFDFDPRGRALDAVGRDGTNILGWLADHPEDQAVILMGNHDAARVMELAAETDASFAAARALAETASEEAFRAAHPRIPTRAIALRDYASFAEHQRTLVQRLLLADRMRLACVGSRGGVSLLLTHAAVTDAQVTELGGDANAASLADRLNQRLRDAVARVRDAWSSGRAAALDLAPLHVAGRDGREGGGLLYHRPSAKRGDDDAMAPRRFDPRALPRRLVQACGHTGHHKAKKELTPWVRPTAASRDHGGLRTLSVGDEGPAYDMGILPPAPANATLYMIDIELNARVVPDHPLLDLDRVG